MRFCYSVQLGAIWCISVGTLQSYKKDSSSVDICTSQFLHSFFVLKYQSSFKIEVSDVALKLKCTFGHL